MTLKKNTAGGGRGEGRVLRPMPVGKGKEEPPPIEKSM